MCACGPAVLATRETGWRQHRVAGHHQGDDQRHHGAHAGPPIGAPSCRPEARRRRDERHHPSPAASSSSPATR